MIAEARPIKDYEFKSTDNLLLDANVWLMLYGPQGDPSSYRTGYTLMLSKECSRLGAQYISTYW